MITFLKGSIAEKQPTRVVLDVGGVGYEVFIPLSSYDRLPAKGEPCCLLTVDHVREDNHQLFGFMTEAERRAFVLLMGASGVGPKLALGTLSGLSVRDLTAAIVSNDVKRLSAISGIGKKTAARLVVELRDRIDEATALEAIAGADQGLGSDSRTRDAALALVSLGYKQEAAAKMVRAALHSAGAETMTVEALIKAALGS